ncbi:TetR/AcrR family transcriptional regulator [Planococcus sp. N028]|uniref:TetR/AcrR family transcriptional regulator n=1 Tax=Planococcus shixiaomingii TaxID=3058393 RepID=A0ABT8MZL2_9BACL|nr:TetR/AcrR family transcriptional regulator [Planococcus sp. N028]MDN7240877.1 TetR/AcrR family transcriptional regulator [Planococcus sp. N028]
MPKLIDSHKRKNQIAEAAWKVILKLGLEGASARNIAKEAGLSLGSLRYYFDTQEALLEYANELTSERITQRVDEIFENDNNPKEKILQVLFELIPVCGDLKQEAEIRLIFKTHALHKREAYTADKDGVYLAIKNVMSNMVLLNLLKKELELSAETERFFAFMDGLALDSLLRPGYLTDEKAREMILYHLRSICKEDIG